MNVAASNTLEKTVDVPLNFTSFNIGVELPSFTFSVADLVASGPVLQVRLGPSRATIEALGELANSATIPATALVDTGRSPEVSSKTSLLLKRP